MARAVALANDAPLAQVDGLLAEADTTFTDAGYVDDALAAVAAGVFVAAVAGDDALARERRATLLKRAEGRRPRSWLAIADAWTGEHTDVAVSWPQGRDEAYATWRDTVSARRRTG